MTYRVRFTRQAEKDIAKLIAIAVASSAPSFAAGTDGRHLVEMPPEALATMRAELLNNQLQGVTGACVACHLWEEFTAFRIQREPQRLYPGSAANDADFGQPIAA